MGVYEITDDDKGCGSDNSTHGVSLKQENHDDGRTLNISVSDDLDLEKGLSGTEHVVVSVSGMTCMACEAKLEKCIASLHSISNPKTSHVLSRAEFDVDLAATSVAEVIRHIERITDFKCAQIANVGSELHVIPNDIPAFLEQDMPLGVTNMDQVDKKTVRVCFDARKIGARRLINEGFGVPAQLAPPRGDPSLAEGSKQVRHAGVMTVISALLTIPVVVLAWAPIPKRPILYGSISLGLATIVQVVVAGPFYENALRALIFSRTIEMDLLIVMSTTVAYVYSVISFGYLVHGTPLATHQFFETSTLLVTLIMIGEFVSTLARQKAVESISIRSLQASTAILALEDHNESEIDSRLLQYGDIFKVMPDSGIPTDGTIICGSSEVNESMITGESQLIEKNPGSTVIAGSINGPGVLLVRLTRLPGDNTISAIASMVDEAKLSKPKIQKIANKVASYFVPVVLLLATITLLIWIPIGLKVRKQSASQAVIKAITHAITVLIVSCPCAIGLAVPMVIVIAGGVAAERGIIFKSGHVIEVAWKTTHVVFDKTGTLTQGKLTIEAEEYPSGKQDAVRAQLLGLVAGIKHPVSTAIAAHLVEQGTDAASIEDVRTLTGKGVEGVSDGVRVCAGNPRWLQLESDPHVQALLGRGHTVLCAVIGTELCAVFGLKDSLRPEAEATVAELHKRGLTVSIVSGDEDGAVRSVASKLGISNVRSRCSPADKRDYVKAIMTDEKVVAIFCGDGTNDAVALAQATIGVHINETSDVAQSAADTVLVRPSLTGLLILMDLSKAAIRRIAFNFAWSFTYNTFAILLAAGAYVKVTIEPQYAGLGELISVLPVILIALQLKKAKFSQV